MWLALSAIVGVLLIAGVTLMVPSRGEKNAKAAAEARTMILTEERQYVVLLGEDELAGPVDLGTLKIGECPKWLGPEGTLVYYQDGFEVPVEATSPHPSVGLVYLKGPAGQMVGVRKTTDCN